MSDTESQAVCTIDARREGRVTILTIDNQTRRNALPEALKLELHRHVRALMDDKACRAIVLTGAGGVFSSGGDVKRQRAKAESRPDLVGRRVARMGPVADLFELLIGGPKPVVTAVEGLAFGIGLSLAVASDYTVAARNTRFCAAQILRGLCPDGFMYYTVTARVGPGRARELLLSGREFNGEAALGYGLVHEVSEPGKTLEAAMVAAERFAAVPPLAFALTKAAMTNSYQTMEACYRAEVDYQPIVSMSKDHKESVTAFIEKRTPTYTGE